MKIVYSIPTKKEMFAKVSYIISKGFNKPLYVKNKITYTDTSFTIIFELKVVIFSIVQIVRRDISERTALKSVNIQHLDFCVYNHVTVQFATML